MWNCKGTRLANVVDSYVIKFSYCFDIEALVVSVLIGLNLLEFFFSGQECSRTTPAPSIGLPTDLVVLIAPLRE